jgi:glycosyltransferase involved in cell wall biosynthesis
VKVGYHAPPPGSPTGVADYAETLRRALVKLPGAARADLHLYHLGNNRLHARIYEQALQTPGIVVLHDAVLQHFLLGTLTREQYIEEFVYNYGEWNRHVGEELWNDRAACAVDPRYFRYPMLRRALERQLAVIVHNPGAAAIAREHGARDVRIIPHFFEPAERPDAASAERFRQRIAVEPGAFLFGIFGYLRETKRVLPCLDVFRRLHAVLPNTALLVAGEIVSGDLRRLLANIGGDPGVRRIGHLSDEDFRIAAEAVDCCLNLRYPPAGETSGIAIRLMGIGKPVILTESLETSEIPRTAALRVPAGAEEADVLFRQMALVAGFPEIARQIGEEAARYIRARHNLGDAAEQYRQVIESVGALAI